MRTLKLTLSYDGTDFVGWQRQAEGRSIQGVLEDAVSRLDGQPVTIVGAGRTDAGVHATGQVASLTLHTTDVDAQTIRRALNAMLPSDVRVLTVDEAAEGFHARYDAVSKTYHYRLINGPVVPPFAARYAWHVPWSLDLAAMDDAAQRLVGEHDFGAFQSAGGHVRTTTRRVFHSSIARVPPDQLALTSGLVPAVAAMEGQVLVYAVNRIRIPPPHGARDCGHARRGRQRTEQGRCGEHAALGTEPRRGRTNGARARAVSGLRPLSG